MSVPPTAAALDDNKPYPQLAIQLLESVYGRLDGTDLDFPKPLPSTEAGLCANGQRRYLWTDAFAVLNLVSLAEWASSSPPLKDNCMAQTSSQTYLDLAHRLVDCVHESLGRPRSALPEDRMATTTTTNNGNERTITTIGLRIGKERSRKVTDAGMTYDGQYWHYTDKWLLALVRLGRIREAAQLAKSVFPFFYDEVDGGMRWKLSVDGTAPPALQRQSPNDDTMTALITFELIESHLPGDKEKEALSLKKEISLLRRSLQGYRGRVTSDPLGWGLESLYDQWLAEKRTVVLKRLAYDALDVSHLSLPFRLYGALLGAQLCPEAAASVNVTKLIQTSLEHQFRYITRNQHEDHSSINRVMLAAVLLAPGAFSRLPGEPLIQLD